MPGRRPNRRRGWRLRLLPLAGLLLLGGCEPLLVKLLDGYPALPPPADYCRESARLAALTAPGQDGGAAPEAGTAPATARKGSFHEPYVEKRCNDCHNFGSRGGLIKPARQLCFVCHTDFVQGRVVHGPVAVGDCLACHHPHTSVNDSLLLKGQTEICGKCHQEQRLAAAMHDSVLARGMSCSDCHDPHFGEARYFLK